MGADGLYIETRRPWGGLRRKLWDCSMRHLPYGPLQEYDDFSAVLHERVMPIVSDVMVREAARYAEQRREWAGFVVWNGSEFLPWGVDFESAPLSVDFKGRGLCDLPMGHSIVADIHSHIAGVPASFSSEDDLSDQGRVKISVVLGNYRVERTGPRFNWTARYCVEGFFFSDDADPGIEAPSCWVRREVR